MVRFDDLNLTQKGSKEERFNVLAAEIDGAVAGDSSIAEDVAALKTTVGSATGDNPSGLANDVDDIRDYIAEILAANDSLTDPRASNG